MYTATQQRTAVFTVAIGPQASFQSRSRKPGARQQGLDEERAGLGGGGKACVVVMLGKVDLVVSLAHKKHPPKIAVG